MGGTVTLTRCALFALKSFRVHATGIQVRGKQAYQPEVVLRRGLACAPSQQATGPMAGDSPHQSLSLETKTRRIQQKKGAESSRANVANEPEAELFPREEDLPEARQSEPSPEEENLDSTSQGGECLPRGLYLVGTPIGNLEDVTLRALRVLRQASLILAEDTRHSAKLLRHYSIGTPMMSYHQFNTSSRRESVIQRLHGGDAIALISDAGMPAISDPGAELVQACVAENLPVTPIPGPSAVIAAVASSGFTSSREFCFLGFPPEKASHRSKRLMQASAMDASQVLYASPHKLMPLLTACVETFGGERQCLVARELTKMHEELWRGTLAEAVNDFGNRRSIKGEITVVIEGSLGISSKGLESEGEREEEMGERLRELMGSGVSLSDAVKCVVDEFGGKRKEVYTLALTLKES